MACNQVLTCPIFPLKWASFPIKISRNAQWEHFFSIYFDDFSTIYLIFWSKSPFFNEKIISQWEHHILLIKACHAIRQVLNCFISMIISVESCCGFLPLRVKGCLFKNVFRIYAREHCGPSAVPIIIVKSVIIKSPFLT